MLLEWRFEKNFFSGRTFLKLCYPWTDVRTTVDKRMYEIKLEKSCGALK